MLRRRNSEHLDLGQDGRGAAMLQLISSTTMERKKPFQLHRRTHETEGFASSFAPLVRRYRMVFEGEHIHSVGCENRHVALS